MPNRIRVFDEPFSITTTLIPSFVIPFSSGNTALPTTYYPNGNGNSTVAICGFGTNGITSLGKGIDNEVFINPSANNVYSFMTVTDIYCVTITAEVFVSTAITAAYTLSPFIALAISEPNNNAFRILPETKVNIANQTNFTANTIYPKTALSIPVTIPRNSRVAIICGHTNSTPTTASTQSFYFSGGIAMW